MSRKVPIALVVALTVGSGACSGDDEGPERADRPFCVIHEEVDDALSRAFEESGPDASEAEQNAALVEAADALRSDGELEAMADAAPPEIADDVRTVVAGLEAVADGDASAIVGGDVDAARATVEEHCFAVGGADADEEAAPPRLS